MRRKTNTIIDPEKCTGCGLCVKVCPSDTLTMKDGKAVVTGPYSLGCEHCVAVCPVDAVTVGFVDSDALRFETLPNDDEYVKPGSYDAAALIRLMKSRRSTRDFAPDPLPLSRLNDFVRIGLTAPTGTNSQLWTFTIIPDRDSVAAFAKQLGRFFEKLNKMAESALARGISRVFMKDVLGEYYQDYYESVKEGLRQYREEGRDRLFHGAPAVILIGSAPGASCPAEDALLATQNIVLAAHALGYGTCLIGFAVEAMKNDPKLKDFLGIPRDEKIYSVIALGKPREKYRRPAGRKKVTPRVFSVSASRPETRR
jgi:nitroreductase/Pyruvate/2-oxoacid:ferredoxin oxidoreductase delta subunit